MWDFQYQPSCKLQCSIYQDETKHTFIWSRKWDGSVIYAKNSVLATQYIINCRRSGRTTESFGNKLYILISS